MTQNPAPHTPPLTQPPRAARQSAGSQPDYAADLYPTRSPASEHRPGPFVVLALAGISVIALLGGGLLGSLVRGDQGTGGGPPGASAVAGLPSVESEPATPQPGVAEEAPSEEPAAEPEAPRIFTDGFTLQSQPCGSEPTGPECNASGTINNGTVWVLLSFGKGEPADILGVTVVAGGDQPVGGGEVTLGDLGCIAPCDGWTYFSLSGLEPGPYRVNISRNGEPAGTTQFETEPD